MASSLLNPVRGYNFLVTLVEVNNSIAGLFSGSENVAMGGFSECSGLEMALQVEEYREGGNNGTVLKFPTRTTWSNIRLRRGVSFSDDLRLWHHNFVEGRGARRDGLIILQNDMLIPVRMWRFSNGLPVKWTGPSLNAAQSQVAIEELEIAHEGLNMSKPPSVTTAIKSLFS